MGYYIRILTPSEGLGLPLADIRASAPGMTIECLEPDAQWSSFTLLRDDGTWLSEVSYEPVTPDSTAAEEIEELRVSLADALPRSGAEWASTYLLGVKAIYAFAINTAEIGDADWPVFQEMKNAIFGRVGGILQADNEGFTNEDGYQIVWEFSDTPDSRMWWMALRDGDGWTTFAVDLGNPRHRSSFKAGMMPFGVFPGEPT